MMFFKTRASVKSDSKVGMFSMYFVFATHNLHFQHHSPCNVEKSVLFNTTASVKETCRIVCFTFFCFLFKQHAFSTAPSAPLLPGKLDFWISLNYTCMILLLIIQVDMKPIEAMRNLKRSNVSPVGTCRIFQAKQSLHKPAWNIGGCKSLVQL